MTIHLVDRSTKATLCGFSLLVEDLPPYHQAIPRGDHWMYTDNKTRAAHADLLCGFCSSHDTNKTRQSLHYRPMYAAPTDQRILLKHWNYHYQPIRVRSRTLGSEWQRTPQPVWTEVHWVSNQDTTGSPAHWEEWTGDPRCHSSHHIETDDCIGWLPVPPEDVTTLKPQLMCSHCGRYQNEAAQAGSTHCIPPFVRQPHNFTREHPYLNED